MSNINVTKVELVFENCEEMVLFPDDIISVHIKGITKEIQIYSEVVTEYHTAEYVYLSISKEKFCEYTGHYGGVTQIFIYYEGGESEWFYVPYEEGLHQENDLERARKDYSGYIIEIGKCL